MRLKIELLKTLDDQIIDLIASGTTEGEGNFTGRSKNGKNFWMFSKALSTKTKASQPSTNSPTCEV